MDIRILTGREAEQLIRDLDQEVEEIREAAVSAGAKSTEGLITPVGDTPRGIDAD